MGEAGTNALIAEKSPYLLQHAHNPVDWLPWGEEAFRKARDEDKPIFLSVGYSTCHWCHVMEKESFESEEIAALMNRHFVNVKVDREERPDVDLTYMTFVQATTGQGGWPMSVWLTPDLKPMMGGTYFPPEDRQGRVGFPRVLERIAELWETEKEELLRQGDKITGMLREATGSRSAGETPGEAVFNAARTQLSSSFETEHGGFSRAPKFPRPVALNLLFRLSTAADSEAARCKEMALTTLREMGKGGMHDHLGGGFHRYSVDRYWHVPHFEKMLYDQAQLAVSYLEGFQIAGEEDFRGIAEGIFEYVRRDLTAPEGGFYSAEDADSLAHADAGEKIEGAFFTWTWKQLEEALGVGTSECKVFASAYGATPQGNVRPESDPIGELRGANVLFRDKRDGEVSAELGLGEREVAETLARVRERLREVQAERPRPHLDDKIITAWNGLMISALAKGYQVLGEESYLKEALRAAEFIHGNLRDASSGELLRSYREGPGKVPGFASDYAFLVQGLLDLYEATFELRWMRWALELQEVMESRFLDGEGGGYFSVSESSENSILSIVEDHDGAEPAPGSVAALNLLRLAAMTGSPRWGDRGGAVLRSASRVLDSAPVAMPQMAVALDFSLSGAAQIVIAAGDNWNAVRGDFVRAIYGKFRPRKTVIVLDGEEDRAFFAREAPAVSEMGPIEGKSGVYVCRDFTCQRPVTEVGELVIG